MPRARPQPVRPDLSDFERSSRLVAGSAEMELMAAAAGDGDEQQPAGIPFEVLCWMGLDPVVYLGEQAATAPVKDAELYFIEHEDPAIVAETEAWLWPLLPEALQAVCRSVAFGAMPYVLDWDVRDLRIKIHREGGGSEDAVLSAHQHFAALHELSPGEVTIEVDQTNAERLSALVLETRRYGTDRAFVSVWDRQFGRWAGQGSRRRAHKWWRRSIRIDRWEARYLERSVDPPRVGYAPPGDITIDGRKVKATALLSSALLALKNGGATTLPAELSANGQKLWEVSVLQLPDRSDVWQRAANRFDALKLYACLAPPTVIGVDEATFASARITDKMFVEFEQAIARFVAAELTKIVAVVHRVMHGDAVDPPRVRAGALPQAKEKLYLEVFRIVADVERRLKDGRRVTMAEQVKDSLLDVLKLPRAPAEEVARLPHEPPVMGKTQGRPRDSMSEREQRREAAREPDDQGG